SAEFVDGGATLLADINHEQDEGKDVPETAYRFDIAARTQTKIAGSYDFDGSDVGTVWMFNGDIDGIEITDPHSEKQISVLRSTDGKLKSFAFDRSGRFGVTAAANATGRVWDLQTKREIATIHGVNVQNVGTLAVAPGAAWVVAVDNRKNLGTIWSTDPVKPIGHIGAIARIAPATAMSADGRRFVGFSPDQIPFVAQSCAGFVDGRTSSRFRPNGKALSGIFSVDPSGTLCAYADKPEGLSNRALGEPVVAAGYIDTAQTHAVLLAHAGDHGVTMVSDCDGEILGRFEVSASDITDIAVSGDGHVAAFGDADGAVALVRLPERDASWLARMTRDYHSLEQALLGWISSSPPAAPSIPCEICGHIKLKSPDESADASGDDDASSQAVEDRVDAATGLWPVSGGVTSEFGANADGTRNDGIDIAALSGTPVHAVAAGEVRYTGNGVPGFGNLVLIDHAGGYSTVYAHLAQSLVKLHQKIAQGDVIGYVGQTGNVASPQLHFEVRQGDAPVDPRTGVAAVQGGTADASSAMPSFVWPITGRVILKFGATLDGERNDGINIAAREGTSIHAAADGTVSYTGDELRGYGNLILIQHDDGYITAYAHCRTIAVARGDHVNKGQVIGEVGQTGAVARPQLHFELRKDKRPIDPNLFVKNTTPP
ncbi:MAG TPA: peptidoglycan DD-metalloendopeptidase family protein, partial [Rhizomicrobium sp.]|nr:peptidoglycan DD-metalloendopeptidase family protein [Rhizomicrobium sp.]